MRSIKITKVTLNIGVGKPGDQLDKSIKLLQKISNKKPVTTKTLKRIPTWGLRPNLQIGTKVTLRGAEAEQLLLRLLQAVENKLKPASFDSFGNFAFGIHEYIDIPGVEYDVDIGIIGLEVAVTLERPGFRIKRRRLLRRRIPMRHRITREEAIDFIRSKFNTKIGEEE
ncbi:MAG TPA: 50S ribosomal protein L5 [Candidatus Nanoarchaeia archaeon]|nr:hypothetical protein [uncultured archaeon]AQS34176.1 hypothetical protein [uncultured archaeon]HLC56554.1 50S ribosomal protein L5 [Candidatus Nanoarchaeia archaeon]